MNDCAESLSQCPDDISSVQDLFTRSKQAAKRQWADAMMGVVWEGEESQRDRWLRLIQSYESSGGADIDAVTPLKNALADRDAFFHLLTHNGASTFESINLVDPTSWMAFLASYSEREMAAGVLARRWIRSMPESVIQKLSSTMNYHELLLVSDLTTLTRYADHAMIKVFELMRDGGLQPTTSPGDNGIQYLFEVSAGELGSDTSLVPYAMMFPIEWGKLTDRMRIFSQRISESVKQGEIPQSYMLLSRYLNTLATVYGSTETDPEKLNAIWDEAEDECVALQQSDCPVILHPMGSPSITGEAMKIDPEINISLHLPQERALEQEVAEYVELARAFAQPLVDHGNLSRVSPAVFMLHHVLSGGSNIFWQIQGISGEHDILCYVNRIREEFIRDYVPVLERIVGRPLDTVERATFLRIFLFATAGHELGHTLVNIEDKKIKKHIGTHHDSYILDELKADSTWAWFLRAQELSQEEAITRVQAYLAWCLLYMKNNSSNEGNSGQQYHMLGRIEASVLIAECGISCGTDGIFIADPIRGLHALAQLSDSLRAVCLDPELSEAKVKEAVAHMRKVSDRQEETLQSLLTYVFPKHDMSRNGGS